MATRTALRSPSGPVVARIPVATIFRAENRTYFLILGTTTFLVLFGLVMVLSSSFVEAQSTGDDPFGVFIRQSLYAVIGIPLMLLASRMPVSFWKRWAWPAVLLGGVLQLLVFVPGIGFGYGGNTNWISIGTITAQPSEFVKFALIVWVAWVLSTKEHVLADWKELAIPVAPVTGLAIGLVLIGNDLGTASVMVLIVLGSMFFAGAKLRFLLVAVIAIGLIVRVIAFASPSRTQRIDIWLNGCTEADYQGLCWQLQHGMWALASGGVLGVGLGNSKAKRNWLPEAENDFIFAIIGEELGLIGAVVVLALFVVLAIGFVRVIRTARDSYARIAVAGVMVWVIGQAFANIAVVLGVLPVLGVPLPLISAGGSALIATLLGIGLVLSFARNGRAAQREPVEQSPADRSRLLAAERGRSRS